MNKTFIILVSFLVLQSCKQTKIDYLKKNRFDLTSNDFDFPQKDFNIIGFGAYHGSAETENVELKLLQSLTPKGTIKYYTVKDALSTEILRGTISSGKGGSRRATDKEMMEVTLDEYWNYNALRNVGWSVFFTSSGQSLEFLDKADAEEYIERKRLNDVSDQYMSKGGGVGKEKKLSKALIVKILKAKGYKKAVGKTVRTPSNKRGYSYGNDVQYKFEESYIISADNYAISIEQVGGHNWNENYLAEICDVLIENGIKCKNEISYLSIIKSDWLIDDGLSSKMAKGGSLDNIKLLAPNGNPSNLTPEQYSLVRTDAFKKWFGDWENDPENSSKVIDKNGEPLQQSHFTNAKFTKFKNKESGFHFGDKSIKGDLSIAKGGDLYEELVVFLNIRNPLRVKDSHRFDPSILIEQLSNDNVISSEQYDKLSEDLYDVEENLTEDESYDDWALTNKQSDILIKVLNGLGYDGLIYENKFDSQDSKLAYLIDEDSSQIYVRNNDGIFVGDVVLESESSKRAIINFVSHNGNLYVIEEDNGEELTELNKKRIKEIIDLGGFVKVLNSPKTYTDVDLFLGQKSFLDSWVAFEPNQIKLADGKNTKFDGGKPDIRFDDGGEVTESNNFKKWFGDSKVVDKEGNPLVVYHGTDKEFNVFDENIGKKWANKFGFFFTIDRDFAEMYGDKTMPVYLSLSNPKKISYDKFDGYRMKHHGDNEWWNSLRKDIEKDGYDGIIINQKTENFGELEVKSGGFYIAFRPNQIKLADGKNTKFDVDNPDIRFEDGGYVKTSSWFKGELSFLNW